MSAPQVLLFLEGAKKEAKKPLRQGSALTTRRGAAPDPANFFKKFDQNICHDGGNAERC